MNPLFKIDLNSLFNDVYSGEEKDLRNKIRYILNDPEFRRLFSELVIEKIVERTQKGEDKDGESLGTYSALYKQSATFKIYKGMKRKVNLTLTGDMLSDMQNFRKNKGEISIGFSDSDNKKKAYGHITGFRGHPFIKKAKKRDFLGLPNDILKKILKDSILLYFNTGSSRLVDIYKATEDIKENI